MFGLAKHKSLFNNQVYFWHSEIIARGSYQQNSLFFSGEKNIGTMTTFNRAIEYAVVI